MVRPVPADHFRTGVWAAAGPLRLRHHTCTQCGHRSATWVAFQAHRAVCTGELGRTARWPTAGAWAGPDELLELLAAARAEELEEAATAALAAGAGAVGVS